MIFQSMVMEYSTDKYKNAPLIAYCKKRETQVADMFIFIQRKGIKKSHPISIGLKTGIPIVMNIYCWHKQHSVCLRTTPY